MTSLEHFVVLKKLTVSGIHIEARQVKATYAVETFEGDKSAIELIYSYEKSYFNKRAADDANLASMMLAQVALNYGLFFEEIEFDGLFDSVDHRFLLDMMENTSREIITNKLLVPNEFLREPFSALQAEQRKKYTMARVSFTNSGFAGMVPDSGSAATDMDKYAILSSGGKDSLLTYGMVKEFGEAFPVFINEAGRHWFTAVNAYRHFKENEPNTEKPWCNSDRVFNWMVRQLPFIRKDYASIRADIYPVRLWTVAVFLFGVLPVVRKNGIGNVLIGDEYDTTVRGCKQGISHYNGLYDQSKYFDNAMSRYYRAKGWGIVQYSMLRSLSEMLIMKVLVKRYPELQQHQVSCHAAHSIGERMHPCGKCEKCRRIIGMLAALDGDPLRCGYSEGQVIAGLDALGRKSVKQIGSDAAHLYHMLVSKKALADNDHTRKLARSHPEIMKLRFDKERSNLEDMPRHARKPVFDILGGYADGAVAREDGRWKEVDLDDAFIQGPDYKFD